MQKCADLCHLLSSCRIWCKQAHNKKGTIKVNANAGCKRFKKYTSIPSNSFIFVKLTLFYGISAVCCLRGRFLSQEPRTDFSMCLIMSKDSIYIRNQKNCNRFLTMLQFNTISSVCLDTNDWQPTLITRFHKGLKIERPERRLKQTWNHRG